MALIRLMEEVIPSTWLIFSISSPLRFTAPRGVPGLVRRLICREKLLVTGVNDSSKEDKFVSGAYKLVQGEHLTDKDKNQILMHEDLAKKNGLKVGDKVRLKSNLYDADNEKGATWNMLLIDFCKAG